MKSQAALVARNSHVSNEFYIVCGYTDLRLGIDTLVYIYIAILVVEKFNDLNSGDLRIFLEK